MKSNIFLINTKSPCYINLDNIASIMVSYESQSSQWKIEFCIAGGEVDRLRFFIKDKKEIDILIENILEACDKNKIPIAIRRNSENCADRNRDGHVLILFLKYNAYINFGSGKIIDIDNREWHRRDFDDIVFRNYENDYENDESDDFNSTENNNYESILKTLLNTNIELMAKLTNLENKISNLNLVQNNSDVSSTLQKRDLSIKIPSQEEMKEEIANNRNSFLRRS